ncbi:MAG: cobalt-precorrin 5A hydrolase [Eubacteriales bacterium]|nr:cobalt-precorrin 5A hydrolase [Eubacteriales bacterium]
MKIAVISFTREGSRLCGRIVRGFREQGQECDGYVQAKFLDGRQEAGIRVSEEPVSQWTGRMFGQADGIIFVGAAGIAVRAVAPYLRDKLTDPAVLVCDEQANFVISLLSGHVGGANGLAVRTARMLGAVPVITTASDVQGLTAIDVWAKERKLVISDRELAKQVAAARLDGEPVGFFSDYRLKGPVPQGYVSGQRFRENVWVTCRTETPDLVLGTVMGLVTDSAPGFAADSATDSVTLRLIPRVLTVGIGSRKNVEAQKVEDAVRQAFEKHALDLRAVKQIASIDLKRDEDGICRLARRLQVPFLTFSAEELEAVPGNLAESPLVRRVTGTGNVCERAALRAVGAGAIKEAGAVDSASAAEASGTVDGAGAAETSEAVKSAGIAEETGTTWELVVRKERYDGVTVAVVHEMTEIGAEQE